MAATDVPALEAAGVVGAFGPGTPLDSVVHFLRDNVKQRTAAI
jgi:methylmalonyl-CoA mutase cobalamin-binding subunit